MHRPERLTAPLRDRDAFDVERIEIAIERRDRARVVPFPHEQRAEVRRVHFALPARGVLDLQRHQPARRLELLENRADRAFGEHAERGAEHLEVEPAVHEPGIQQVRDDREQLVRIALVREIDGRQRAGLERLAEQAAAGQEEAKKRLRAVRSVRRALPDAIVAGEPRRAIPSTRTTMRAARECARSGADRWRGNGTGSSPSTGPRNPATSLRRAGYACARAQPRWARA